MINVLDIETYKNGNSVIPYCVCFSLKEKMYSFYNENNIIIKCLNKISELIEDEVEFFIHNLNFDGIIIINFISLNNIKYEMISDKTNLYSIKIYYCGKIIIFKCSYKIIPESLRKLGVIENFRKTYFPYRFVNESTLNYIGFLPEKEF
jgi:hypothetical protein